MVERALRVANIAAKGLLFVLLLYAVLRPDLPQFEGKTLRAVPTIHIPPDCQPVDVPLDPALAIGKRFGTLIEQKTTGDA